MSYLIIDVTNHTSNAMGKKIVSPFLSNEVKVCGNWQGGDIALVIALIPNIL